MSFRDNLQHLRATRNMTQEQLAMLVGVSRQSVTKWEAERAYPEMDKLIKISQIFDCSLDDLINGDLTGREAEPALSPTPALADVTGYDEHMRTSAVRIALGVTFIILGVAAAAFLEGATPMLSDPDAGSALAVLAGVALGLFLIIPTGVAMYSFQKAHPFVEDFYTSEDRSRAEAQMGYEIAGGIVLILIGVSIAIAFDTTTGAGIMLILIALGVGLNVHGGMFGGRTDIEDYNIEALSELTEEEVASIVGEERAPSVLAKVRNRRRYGSICGIIMLVATIVGLCLLFWGQANGGFFQRFFWIPWMVGGLLCAIVGVARSMDDK